MASKTFVSIEAAVEGVVDEAVVRRVVAETEATLSAVHGHKGKDHLRQQVRRYNQASRDSRWLVLVDLDRDAACAPPFVVAWLPDPAPGMCFRVAVRAIEAWLLADRQQIADFLGVPLSKIPRQPEREADPKRKMIQLANSSKRKDIRADMTKSGAQVGTGYAARLIEFVRTRWRPDVAARNSDSLRRCRDRLKELFD